MTHYRVSRNGYADSYVDASEVDIFGHLTLSGPAPEPGRAGRGSKTPVAVYADGQWTAVVSTDAELFTDREVNERVEAILGNVRDRVTRWRDEQGENNPPRRNAYDNVLAELDERLRRLDAGEPAF